MDFKLLLFKKTFNLLYFISQNQLAKLLEKGKRLSNYKQNEISTFLNKWTIKRIKNNLNIQKKRSLFYELHHINLNLEIPLNNHSFENCKFKFNGIGQYFVLGFTFLFYLLIVIVALASLDFKILFLLPFASPLWIFYLKIYSDEYKDLNNNLSDIIEIYVSDEELILKEEGDEG